MITELIKDKFLNKEIEIYLNGHIYYHPKNPSFYDGKRETTEWELELSPDREITHEDGSWSKFRNIKTKTVKVLEVVMIPDCEGTTWHLTCQGKKGNKYSVQIPE